MPGNPVRLVANLKDKSLGLLLHQRATGILNIIEERPLDVARVANVNHSRAFEIPYRPGA
jgi:hypothetical protein